MMYRLSYYTNDNRSNVTTYDFQTYPEINMISDRDSVIKISNKSMLVIIPVRNFISIELLKN